MKTKDVIIVGGGLAGLTAALHLLKYGYTVTVFEKNGFPKHKVCGEYISNEVVPYLQSLQLDLESLEPKHIDRLSFSLVSGKIISTALPLGGLGISRFAMDYYLYRQVKERGGNILQETVTEILFKDNQFSILTSSGSYCASLVFGAFGKRSNLDVKLNRTFLGKPSNWLGVKAHYALPFDDNLVGLHHFKGGYCGISKVENDRVNICYLGNYESFKKYKNIQEYQEKVVAENPHLKSVFEKAEMQFESPITISQISFESKSTIENHMLMIGDTAGLIHPLCGNGMAMAIHSAKLACDAAIPFLNDGWSRLEMEKQYTKNWKHTFKTRLKTGRWLGYLLQKEALASVVLQMTLLFPFLLTILIKRTHGKPI